MNRIRVWKRNFNWRMVVVRVLVNMLSLLLTVAILPNIYFVDKRVGAWLYLALMLGLLNVFIKPIIAFLALRFIFATAGLVLVVINGLILALLSWISPNLIGVGTLLSALLGGAVLGLSSAFLEALFGLNPPIVAEKYPEIREHIKDRQFYRTPLVPPQIAARTLLRVGELEVETDAAAAALPPLAARSASAVAEDASLAPDSKTVLAADTSEPGA